jgi:hypothetical protein
MTTALEVFLNEIGKHVPPRKEKTLFSLGGRGYYENPASDLLAFFLKPDAEHGFKALFLQTFLDCMKIDSADMGMADVTVSREEYTVEGNRIDIVVQSPDWVLLIENKIYHIQNNPFDSYTAYGRSLPGGKKRLMMGILSPQGESVPEGWTPVSYQDYCTTLRRRLVEEFFDRTYSKWVVFAREFILHFENELYQPTMNNQDADYVEQHAEQIEQAKKLESDYRDFLSELLKSSLQTAIASHAFRTKAETWGIRCYADKWRYSHLAFLLNFSGKSPEFGVRIYLEDFTPEQKAQALQMFHGMKRDVEGEKCLTWQTQIGFGNRKAAVDELCRLGGLLAELFKSPPIPA